ncbi:MAG TPA: hypothetical protein VEL51_11855 [Vicinamibacterales bacterium]|nr:hypothetical protein [Vicinamibacterales bacterium]
MFRRVAALTVMFLTATSLTVFASETAVAGTPLKSAVARAAKDADPALASWAVLESSSKRPATLTTLYATYGVVQALDIVSTRRALAAGANERNPLMGGGHFGTMIAVKAATGASTIFFAERMWKKNKVGAIVMMVALNGASAAIAAHNQHNARR